MKVIKPIQDLLKNLRRSISDERGTSALEFALIAPILIMIWLSSVILNEAITLQQRASHVSSAVGDLVAHESVLPSGYVSDAFAAGQTIMQPATSTSLIMRVSSVVVQSNSTATITWSCASPGIAANPVGLNAPASGLPAGTISGSTPGDSIIVSESWYNYVPSITYGLFPSFYTFYYINYTKPRGLAAIAPPSNC